MKRPPKNIAASVRQRLLILARERGEDFQYVLTRYGAERLLYRLSKSPQRNRLVLKGATLFSIWTSTPYRPTRDLDFEGSGDGSPAAVESLLRDICAMPVEPDGLEFDAKGVTGEEIRADQQYGGVRIKLVATLAGARIPLQVDVGFGDCIAPDAVETEYPTFLDLPAPRVLTYPRESVVAEKFQAITALGLVNTRLKDFSDVWTMSRELDFDGVALRSAIKATFARRRTPLPDEPPVALTARFYDDPAKLQQWRALQEKGASDRELLSLADVVADVRDFVLPPVTSLVREQAFDMHWPARGPWIEF